MNPITRRLLPIVAVIGLLSGAAFAAEPSTLDAVRARGTLIAGLRNDFPPAGFVDAQGNWVGFEVELAQYVADKLGVKLERVAVTSRTRIPMLLNGNIDLIMASMGPTSERAQTIDFSIPYFISGTRVLTRKGSGIESVKDLAAPRKTGMVQGGSDAAIVMRLQPKADIVYFQEWPMAALALKQGQIDAIATADYTLHLLAKDDPSLVIVGSSFIVDRPVIGVRQNDSKWRLFLDSAIGQAWQDGTIEKLHVKYLGEKPPFQLFVWREFYVSPK